MPDQRDELALFHFEIETVDDLQWSLRRRVNLFELREFEVAISARRSGRFLIGSGKRHLVAAQCYGNDVRQLSRLSCLRSALRTQVPTYAPTRPPPAHPARAALRAHALLTIDGSEARDYDDADYRERAREGWRLLGPIAVFAHYVEVESPLD